MLTTTEAYDDAALTALIAAANVLGTALHAGLYTNVIDPTKVLTIGDLTEPTWATYARQAVVMGAPIRDPLNGIASLSDALVWQQTGTPTPVTIIGIFYVFGAGPALLGIEPFQSPISLNDTLDAFSTLLEYLQSQQAPGFTTVVQ